MRGALLALVLLGGATATGCATRGTLAELGKPEFADAALGERLTLVEPVVDGQFHAYGPEGGEGDYRSETRMQVAPHRDGDDIVFDLIARPRGDRRIELVELLAYPLSPKDLIRFKDRGALPEGTREVARVRSDKRVPAREHHHLDVRVKASDVAGYDQLAVPILLRFEDGWVTIIYTVVLVPPPQGQ